ncbi:MAG: hypothetical protein PHG06_19070 [Parabacteroides sp.]|nr:hypothetical protein [Parabacteroides sp.]
MYYVRKRQIVSFNYRIRYSIAKLNPIFGFTFLKPEHGLITAILAGLCKELYDKFIEKHEADPIDSLATTLGAIMGLVIAILILNAIG